MLLILPTLLTIPQNWARLDQSQDDGGQPWGAAVLALPLAENAAILADSEKIAPLYYLQQAEGVRPDLDIMVLPDEAAYRAELDSRLAAGQTVYLARFLPGLEGITHLRSVGPLTEVSREPLTTLPETAVPTTLSFGPIELIGYELAGVSPYDEGQTAVTLYWQAAEPVTQPLHVYLRLGGETTSGQHPANNTYPTNAWKDAEIVADFHQLPRPRRSSSEKIDLQVALAPPFAAIDSLEWKTITSIWAQEGFNLSAPSENNLRHQIGTLLLYGIDFPRQVRPASRLTVQTTGWGTDKNGLQLQLRSENESQDSPFPTKPSWPPKNPPPFSQAVELPTDLPVGMYQIYATFPRFTSRCGMAGDECKIPESYCGWFTFASEGCVLGEVEISGVALPETAVNYNDQIALLNFDISSKQLTPGGRLGLSLQWTGLAPLDKDYTLFLQVLDANDRLVGQVDAWPLQGTLPTGQWLAGQPITDPYTIQLDGDLPPGDYRLLIGWYLLADLRRLPVLNADGQPVDDKFVIPGFIVEK